MATLIEELPGRIARLESTHGSDNPFVQQLKEQLRAMKETSGRSTEELFRMSARPNFNFKSDQNDSESDTICKDKK